MTIWDAMGSDAQHFAQNFSADHYSELEYTTYGEGGASVYRTSDTELIQALYDALCDIAVTMQTDVSADDFEDVFRFCSKDDSFAVRFNMRNLDVGSTFYNIENDTALWHAADSVIEKGTEDPQEKTVISGKMNFSFTSPGACENEENNTGTVFVYLLSGIDSHPYVRVERIADGTDAKQCLQNTADELRSESKLISEPGQIEMLEKDGRDLYRISFDFYLDDLEMSFTGYTEDYDDGSVMFFCYLCETKYRDTAEDILQTAIDSVWVGELDEETAAGESDSSDKTVTGRWSFTETPLASGDIEYCFDDALIMEIPASWVGKVFWKVEGSRFSFYHSDSYKALEKERSDGGLLFSIGYYSDNSYESLPSYQYLGRAKDGSYVMIFPFEDQLCLEDPELLTEWQALFDSMTYILDNTYSMIFE